MYVSFRDMRDRGVGEERITPFVGSEVFEMFDLSRGTVGVHRGCLELEDGL